MSPLLTTMPGLMTGLSATIRRDLLLAWKRPGDVLNPLVFFIMVCTLFPLAIGPSVEEMRYAAPGVLWVAALLAMLLSLNSLFLADFEDGSLEQMLVSPQPLVVLALAKTAAHWLTNGLPLVILSPVAALAFRLPADTVLVLVNTLLLGTLSLSLLGAVGAALTVGLHRGTALLSLLILPISMPVLIFGTRTVSLAAAGDSFATGLYALAGYAFAALSLAPFATAAALRISNE